MCGFPKKTHTHIYTIHSLKLINLNL